MTWWINGITNDAELIAALQGEIDSLDQDTTDPRLLALAIDRLRSLTEENERLRKSLENPEPLSPLG